LTLAGSVRQTARKATPFLGRRTCHIWLLRYIPDDRVTFWTPYERSSWMRRAVNELEQTRKARARLRMIQHYEQVTHNVSQTCRFFGISHTQFYTAMIRI